MNPYPARIEELHQWLEDRYGQRDRQATEILLACLLDTKITGRPHPWVIIETDYYSREYAFAWFSFGDVARVRSLAEPRTLHSRDRERIIRSWRDHRVVGGMYGLIAECEWRRLQNNGIGRNNRLLHDGGMYRALLASCLRLRVEHPKGPHALRSPEEREADRAELARRASRVLDPMLRSALSPRAFADDLARKHDAIAYWCELMQVTSPIMSDWEALTSQLISVAYGVAMLYSDGRLPDWQSAERALRDSIPYFTERVLKTAVIEKLHGRKAQLICIRAGVEFDNRGPGYKEIVRLRRLGVLKECAKGAGDWHRLLNRDERIFV